LEAAVALGRPDPVTRKVESVPSLGSLRRLYVEPGNAGRLAADRARPTVDRAALRMIAARGDAVDPEWLSPADGLVSLVRLRAIEAERDRDECARSDGFLGAAATALALPGLDPEHAVSASALRVLLACPYRFLLERVLRFRPADGAP